MGYIKVRIPRPRQGHRLTIASRKNLFRAAEKLSHGITFVSWPSTCGIFFLDRILGLGAAARPGRGTRDKLRQATTWNGSTHIEGT